MSSAVFFTMPAKRSVNVLSLFINIYHSFVSFTLISLSFIAVSFSPSELLSDCISLDILPFFSRQTSPFVLRASFHHIMVADQESHVYIIKPEVNEFTLQKHAYSHI